MSHRVLLATQAEDDIVAIHAWVVRGQGREAADHVRDGLIETISSLVELPGRGHHPPELARLGVFDYREVHWTRYRVIYSTGETVVVHAVFDGRRSVQDVLAERLLRR